MKIGILTCIRANDVCTGAGCLNAFYDRTNAFYRYEENIRLGVFMTCNDCEDRQPLEPEDDPGMQEKLERLVQEDIKIIHVGVCAWLKNDKSESYLCPRIKKICRMMENMGIQVVQGTHGK